MKEKQNKFHKTTFVKKTKIKAKPNAEMDNEYTLNEAITVNNEDERPIKVQTETSPKNNESDNAAENSSPDDTETDPEMTEM